MAGGTLNTREFEIVVYQPVKVDRFDVIQLMNITRPLIIKIITV